MRPNASSSMSMVSNTKAATFVATMPLKAVRGKAAEQLILISPIDPISPIRGVGLKNPNPTAKTSGCSL